MSYSGRNAMTCPKCKARMRVIGRKEGKVKDKKVFVEYGWECPLCHHTLKTARIEDKK